MAAGIIDVISLILTIVVCGGFVYGVTRVVQAVNRGVAQTKENLKSKGMNISKSGVSVKTDRTFDREAYLNATQRGIMHVLEASSFRKGGAEDSPVLSPPGLATRTSSTSSGVSGKSAKRRS